MSRVHREIKIEMFKRAIRGEDYSSIAEDYEYNSTTIGNFVKEIIASIDTPENREKIIAEFPFSNKKFQRAYNYHGTYVSISSVSIVHLRLKAEFLIQLVKPVFVVPKKIEEKLHLLNLLAFKIRISLSEKYAKFTPSRSYKHYDLMDTPVEINLIKQMVLVAFNLDSKPFIELEEVTNKIFSPKISNGAIIPFNNPLLSDENVVVFDKFYELISELEKFYLVFP